jgi:hypothetical protein
MEFLNKNKIKFELEVFCCFTSIYIYRVSQEECAGLQEGVPYGKVYRYNPKHLCPKLNGYGFPSVSSVTEILPSYCCRKQTLQL